MKITINTSPQNIEMANFLLGQAYKDVIKNERFQKHFEVTPKQLEGAEKFRKALLNAFTKGRI